MESWIGKHIENRNDFANDSPLSYMTLPFSLSHIFFSGPFSFLAFSKNFIIS